MADPDITIEVLKAIRSELRDFRGEQSEANRRIEQRLGAVDQRLAIMDERLDLTNQRLDIGNQRLDVVESTLLTLAQRQRAMARGISKISRLVTDLDARVDKLEA